MRRGQLPQLLQSLRHCRVALPARCRYRLLRQVISRTLRLPAKAPRNAIWRAALLARETGASLQVLHVLRDARGADAARLALEQLCANVHERVGVQAAITISGSFSRLRTSPSRDSQ